MKFDPDKHHRRSIRLKEYDYSLSGGYFITIVAWQRECLFGEIVGGEMRLSGFGEIARSEWFKTGELRQNVELLEDEFVVMPNHIHGIIWIKEDDTVGARRRRAPTEQFRKPVKGSIPTIVRAYKSAVAFSINDLRGTRGVSVWQSNYYEHIIRDDADRQRIRRYIESNPIMWADDKENPAKIV